MKKHYHFLGIGGIGMSALARILLEKGEQVSGSDLSENEVTQALRSGGATVVKGHSAEALVGSPIVVYSTAVKQENPEYAEAKRRGLQLLHRSDLLFELMQGQRPLLVAGTHGKTTTSSLLAHTLQHAGAEPSYAIGGIVRSLRSNGGYGTGPYFVAEADESDGSFLRYPASGAIVTNIDNDHLDHWKTEAALLQGFAQFLENVSSKEHLFWCADDAHLKALGLEGVSYGFAPDAQLHISSYEQSGWGSAFNCTFEGKSFNAIATTLIGRHNILNASAVFGLCLRLGLSEQQIRDAFSLFQGVGRRAEKKGEKAGIAVYDDYGHHPTEIIATLQGMKAAIGNRRLVVLFQPHRYTRTKDCIEQFAAAFALADQCILTDLYAAGEPPIPGVDAETLVGRIQQRGFDASYIPKKDLVGYLQRILVPGDVLLTLGAGDVTKIGPELLNELSDD